MHVLYGRVHCFSLYLLSQLGHKAYEPGTATFCKIVETFGESVVGEGGQINRKTLGGMVFGSKVRRPFYNYFINVHIGI